MLERKDKLLSSIESDLVKTSAVESKSVDTRSTSKKYNTIQWSLTAKQLERRKQKYFSRYPAIPAPRSRLLVGRQKSKNDVLSSCVFFVVVWTVVDLFIYIFFFKKEASKWVREATFCELDVKSAGQFCACYLVGLTELSISEHFFSLLLFRAGRVESSV